MDRPVRDIVWLAGFLEGEGYFFFAKTSMAIGVDSTDEDVIRKAATILGCDVWGPYPNGVSARTGQPNKLKWRAQVNSRDAAAWMMTLYSLMGERRRAAIRHVLNQWKQRLPWKGHRTHCLRGHVLSGDNLYVNKRGHRSCKQCEHARVRAQRLLTKPATKGAGHKTQAVH